MLKRDLLPHRTGRAIVSSPTVIKPRRWTESSLHFEMTLVVGSSGRTTILNPFDPSGKIRHHLIDFVERQNGDSRAGCAM